MTWTTPCPTRIAEALGGLPVHHPGIVLEGGSIDVNGAGTLLTTESCLLNPNRNPSLKKSQIEAIIKDYLCVRNVLWLGDGIEGDDTDGHVDDLTRFVDRTTVVTVVEEDEHDPNYEPLQTNLYRLREMSVEDGTPLRVLTLPMPSKIVRDGQRLPASYANFYIGNKVVLMPCVQRSARCVGDIGAAAGVSEPADRAHRQLRIDLGIGGFPLPDPAIARLACKGVGMARVLRRRHVPCPPPFPTKSKPWTTRTRLPGLRTGPGSRSLLRSCWRV